MADVSSSSAGERAQLIIVSGLLVATTLLVLVLLLNTVIYTENVATRGIDSDASEAVEYQRTIERTLGAYLAEEHGSGDAGNWSELEATVNDSIDHVLGHTASLGSEQGRIANSEVELVPGLFAEPDESGSFENATVATHANGTRLFNVTVEEESLDDVLKVGADGGSWSVHLNNSTGEVKLTESDGTPLCGNATFEGEITLDFVAEAVVDDIGSTPCEGDLWGEDGVPPGVSVPFDIEFDVAQSANGTYRLETEVTEDETYAHEDTVPIVFEAFVELEFLSPELQYVTSVVVEGEVP